ncbi:MAG: NAD-dependent epimerase/dehydratase family protein [Woeseiaceae bacterium]
MLAGTAVASGIPAAQGAVDKQKGNKVLSILVLGGTGFIGPHMVREALRRGHSVTLFNRGQTNNELFPDLETIRGDRDGGLDGLQGRSWDAVVDNSGYVPRHVQDSARLLAKNTRRYVYISTVSVYADFDSDNTEDSPLATIADETIEDVTGETYGPLKALCEKRVAAEIEPEQLTVLRPTYIAGPGDRTDRFSYWPIRTRRGGEMIWPGTPADAIQIVDARDLANFVTDSLEQDISGTYNMVNPAGAYTMGGLLDDSQTVTATQVEPVWISEAFAYEHSLVGGRTLPIWHPKTGANAAGGSFSGERAEEAGFENRPERETVRDLLRWWDSLPAERTDKVRAGLEADSEEALVAAWKEQKR